MLKIYTYCKIKINLLDKYLVWENNIWSGKKSVESRGSLSLTEGGHPDERKLPKIVAGPG